MALNILLKQCLNLQKPIVLKQLPAVFNNGMSVFAPYYVDPVYKKDKLAALIESGEAELLKNVPIKPPHIDQTCSDFNDPLVAKFVNCIMKMGKKKLARELLEKSFVNIKRAQIERYHNTTDPEAKAAIELNPKVILYKAVTNSTPLLNLSPIKRGGVTYQVPVPITERQSRFLAIKWLIEAAKERESKIHFPEQMAWELLDASNNRGKVVKRKQDLHKLCEANRAYAHYRWN